MNIRLMERRAFQNSKKATWEASQRFSLKFHQFNTYSSPNCALKCRLQVARKRFVVWTTVLGLNYLKIDCHLSAKLPKSKHSSAKRNDPNCVVFARGNCKDFENQRQESRVPWGLCKILMIFITVKIKCFKSKLYPIWTIFPTKDDDNVVPGPDLQLFWYSNSCNRLFEFYPQKGIFMFWCECNKTRREVCSEEKLKNTVIVNKVGFYTKVFEFGVPNFWNLLCSIFSRNSIILIFY
jgi:hypothetical protein